MAKYVLHCDACGNNTVTDGGDLVDAVQVKLAPIQLHIPKYDPGEKKTVASKFQARRKMFKCTKCGRGVISRKFMVPIMEEKKDGQQDHDSEREGSSPGREIPPEITPGS